MEIKDLKEWCKNKNDEDIVFSCKYSYGSEAYTQPTSVVLRTRPSQKIDFDHEECKHFEIIEIKNKQRGFCNRKNEFFNKYDSKEACRKFESNKEIDYCKECKSCYKGTSCCPLGDKESIYIGDGFVRRGY